MIAPYYQEKIFYASNRLNEASALVEKYHYSHRPPANVQFVGSIHLGGGLFGDLGECVAACFFSIPPTRWKESVWELSRLVRKDDFQFPLTQLISKCCNWIKNSQDLLVSFADIGFHHHGGIYQAASWNYHGARDSRMDGLIVNGEFVPGRTANSLWGTRSPQKLKGLKPLWEITPHYDIGKHLYWRALSKSGQIKAEKLSLFKLPYPKPSQEVLPLGFTAS